MTVDSKKFSDTQDPRANILSKFEFLVVLKGPGRPGAITNRRGMKKIPWGSYFREIWLEL